MREPHRGRNPGPGGSAAGRALAWLFDLLLGRWMYLVGVPMLAFGGAFLAAGWQIGPDYALFQREVASLTGRAEARSVEPFWWLDLDADRARDGDHWSDDAFMKLCITADYSVAGQDYRRVFCGDGREPRLPGDLGVLDVGGILPGVQAAWPRDSAGNPVIALRMSPEVRGLLSSRDAAYWTPVGQTEEVRAAIPPPGTELDTLLLELDRPLEWLVRLWPREGERSVDLRYDAEHPEKAYPETLVGGLEMSSDRLGTSIILLMIGLAVWGTGVVIILFDQSPRTRVIVGVLPLVLVPWWSDAVLGAARWIDRESYHLAADFLPELTLGRRLPISIHDPEAFRGFENIRWPAIGSPSHYAALLEPMGLRRPPVHPEDGDAALLEAVRQIDAAVAVLSDAERARLFDALSQAELNDRGEVALLFLVSARATALDPERSPASRLAAERFITWMTVTPIEPRPREPGFAARTELWRALLDFPPAPGVEAAARRLLERIPGQ
jgi:hypothetical protein